MVLLFGGRFKQGIKGGYMVPDSMLLRNVLGGTIYGAAFSGGDPRGPGGFDPRRFRINCYVVRLGILGCAPGPLEVARAHPINTMCL